MQKHFIKQEHLQEEAEDGVQCRVLFVFNQEIRPQSDG